MLRSQLMKDFEETFKTQFEAHYMYPEKQKDENSGRLVYLDTETAIRFGVWVCAFETYYPHGHVTGD